MVVVFDTFRSGNDGQGLGLVEAVALIDMALVWYVRSVARREVASGRVVPRPSGLGAHIRRHPAATLWIAGVFSAAVLAQVAISHWRDRTAFAEGRYLTVAGPIVTDVVVAVQMPDRERRSVMALPSRTQQTETDLFVVAGRRFSIECRRPLDVPVGVIGRAGACLDGIEAGSRVVIDYLPGRAEPLRILRPD